MKSSLIVIKNVEPATFISERAVAAVLRFCLVILAVNAVLIQTVASEESPLKNVIRVGVLLLGIFIMALEDFALPLGMVLLTLVSALLLVVRQNMDQLSLIFLMVLVMALLHIPERAVEKAIVLASVVSLSLVFLFLAAGVTTNQVLDYRNRMTFGTDGVPFFYNLVYGAFVMLMFYAHKYKLRRRWLVTLASIAAATVLFQLTDARGGYLSFVVFTVLLFTVPLFSKLGIFRFAVALLPVIFLFVAFYIATLGRDGDANRLLSNRPRLYMLFMDQLALPDFLLSSSVKQFDTARSIVDNSYLHLVVGGGIILCIAFFLVYGLAVTNLFAKNRHQEIAFIVASAVYFNSESILLRVENMFVIFFWYLIFANARERLSHGDGQDETTHRLARPNHLHTKQGRVRRVRIPSTNSVPRHPDNHRAGIASPARPDLVPDHLTRHTWRR